MEHLGTDRERMEALCYLYVIGELSAQESADFTQHLTVCESCRDLKGQSEHLAFIDLPSLFAERIGGGEDLQFEESTESRLLDRLLKCAEEERTAGHIPSDPTGRMQVTSSKSPPHPRTRFARVGSYTLAFAGGTIAAALIITAGVRTVGNTYAIGSAQLGAAQQLRRPATESEAKDVQTLRLSSAKTEAAYEGAMGQLTFARSEARRAEAKFTAQTEEYSRLQADKQSLEVALKQQSRLLAENATNLSVVYETLKHESTKSADLEARLQVLNDKLITQGTEVARLQEAALRDSVRVPVPESGPSTREDRDLFGARDLHIVDVYDVDHSGKPSRTFGRVYFVNRQLLVFYAFDLSNRQRERKPVAFQAWGYKQPDSANPENLGLFMMDGARLNRWVLRVSDPKLLAGIDTLFVTMEPPGGSTVPRGHPLLLASLAGPANHP